MKWTERQYEAIKTVDKDILVSASAGSGKTAVLSERIIDLIVTNKVDIDKFIVVTFTKLAANEMRQRIVKNLEKYKENIEDQKEKEMKRFLEKQIILAQKANISTLHSFGLSLIKDYFYLLDLSPNVEMVDEVDEKILKQQVLEKIFNEKYIEKNQHFINLVTMYGGYKSDENLRKLIEKFACFALNMPNPIMALEKATSIYNGDVKKQEEIYNMFKEDAIMVIKQFASCLNEYSNEFSAIENDLTVLNGIILSINSSYIDAQNVLSNIKFATLRFPKEYDEIEKEKIKKNRDEMKKYIKTLSSVYLNFSKNGLDDLLLEMKDEINELVNITKKYILDYNAIKKNMNKIDFNDIEHLTLQLLIDDKGKITDICKEIRATYRYIIVDEYQDINEVQETILKCISTYNSTVPNMFMVGDVKQSIYRFRKADPEIFSQKYNTFSKDKDSKEYKIDLNQNFRSRKEVLNSINSIFEKVMKKEIGDIEYDEEMKLFYGNLYSEEKKQNYNTEQYIIVEQKECKDQEEIIDENKVIDKEKNEIENENENQNTIIEDISKYEKEAILIANKVNEYIKSEYQVYDMKKGTYRKVLYSDITILLRSMGRDAYIIYLKLCQLGIPVTFGREENFMNRLEVLQLINVLRVIDNPYDDISLISTLYSPMFKFSYSDLYEISKTRKKYVTFFETIESYYSDEKNKGGDAHLINKIANFISYYEEWKLIAKRKSIVEVVNTLLEDLDLMYKSLYDKNCLVVQGGIKQFVKLVNRYNKVSNCSLSDFITYVNFIIENKVEIIIQTESEIDDSISMMTIHKSKGLEYPIVFIPTMGKTFNMSDSKEKVIIDKKYGFISSYISSDKYYTKSNFYRQVLIDKLNKENLAEEMRVLYVAMTRAKEKVIMIGTTKDTDFLDKDYRPLTKYYNIKNSKNYLDLVKHSLYDKDNNIDTFVVTDIKYDGEEIKNLELKDFKISDEYRNIESLTYSYSDVIDKIEKVSVTKVKELKSKRSEGLIQTEENCNERNDYHKDVKLFRDNKMTPTEKGTMIHKLMKIVNDSSNVQEQMELLIQNKTFSQEEINEVDLNKIEKYLKSNIYLRIKKAIKVKREMPFMMRKKANEVYYDIVNNEDYVIIQGIIDCMFEEDDGIVILDYKTDKVIFTNDEEKQKRINQIKEEYKEQLDLYEEAIKKLTGKNIKEKVLYLYDIGETVNI